MLKKIDLYLLKEFIHSYLLGLVSFIVIFTMRELFKIIGYITDGRINVSQGIELLFHSFPEVIVEVSPLAILLGSLMAVNKMASNLEITALKTSGISFRRIVRTPILFSFLLSLIIVWFNDHVVPTSNEKKRLFRHTEVYNVTESRIRQNVFMKGKGNYLYYVRLVNGRDKTVSNIQIVEMNNEFSKMQKIITAKKGNYNNEFGFWTLRDVSVIDMVSDKEYSQNNMRADILEENIDDMLRRRVRENELKTEELQENIAFIKTTGGDVKKLLVALYKKIAYPFAGFIMCFVGLALGSRYVRGSSAVSIGISVVIGYSYYVVMSVFEAMGVGGIVSPLLGAWIPNLLFLSIGLIAMKNAEY